MIISCDCGSFKAQLAAFPKHTPGRLMCYCRDCQDFVTRIGRADVLDEFGGTEVIPAYPKEISIVQGKELLACYRLDERGLYRWATTCCNSPILNMKPGFPWAGIFHSAYVSQNPDSLQVLGNIKSRIFGRDAGEGAPAGISNKISFKDMLIVIPFILKGKLFKLGHDSPFFEADNRTPICNPTVLSTDKE